LEVEPSFLIAAYQEELAEAHRSRIMLLAAVKQLSTLVKQLTDERDADQGGED
jgi:hypothetical protein